MSGSDYQNLEVWQRSVALVVKVYKAVNKLPSGERLGIVSQMQRAAISIPSNIAEGYRRHSKAEFKRFLYISSDSIAELETQLLIAERVYSLEVEALLVELTIVQKMIFALINKL